MEDKNRLIEIYKIHANLSDKVSDRRGKTNIFYITLNTSIITVLSLLVNKDNVTNSNEHNLILFFLGVTGVLLCMVWYCNIWSYRKLNSAKFKTLHELEEKIGYAFFKREWEFLDEGKNVKTYVKLSTIEQYSPMILSIPYCVIFIYLVFKNFY